MPREMSTAAEPIRLEDHFGESGAPPVEVFDRIVRSQAPISSDLAAVATARRPRARGSSEGLAILEADLHCLLEQLDAELQSLSTRLDRALSR